MLPDLLYPISSYVRTIQGALKIFIQNLYDTHIYATISVKNLVLGLSVLNIAE